MLCAARTLSVASRAAFLLLADSAAHGYDRVMRLGARSCATILPLLAAFALPFATAATKKGKGKDAVKKESGTLRRSAARPSQPAPPSPVSSRIDTAMVEPVSTQRFAQLIPAPGPSASPAAPRGISDLDFPNAQAIEVLARMGESGPVEIARLTGHYPRDGWTLTIDERVIRPADGFFEFEAPLSPAKDHTEIEAVAIGPFGQRQTDRYRILHPPPASFVVVDGKIVAASSTRRLSVVPSLGLGIVAYSEPKVISAFNETVLHLGAEGAYEILVGKVSIRAGGGAGLVPFGSNPSAFSARVWGAFARAEWLLPRPSPPWGIRVAGGLGISGMIVTGDAFGFAMALAPQLFPIFSRSFGNGQEILLSIRLMPLPTGAGISFKSRELGGGIAWRQAILRGRFMLRVGLETNSTSYVIPTSAGDRELSLTSLIVSGGVGI